MKKYIDGYDITSNCKWQEVLRWEDLTKNQQVDMKKYDYIDDIETEWFVNCKGYPLPKSEVWNFYSCGCVSEEIQQYFYKKYLTCWCGMGGFSLYMNDECIYVFNDEGDKYIKFNLN